MEKERQKASDRRGSQRLSDSLSGSQPIIFDTEALSRSQPLSAALSESQPMESDTDILRGSQRLSEAITETETGKDIKYYVNRIESALGEYESINDCSIKDIKKTEWNAVLMFIYDSVFKLKPNENHRKDKYLPYNDYSLMLSLCDYYILLCYRYNKPINIIGFCHMLNLSEMYIYRHSVNDNCMYIDIDSNNKTVCNSELKSYRTMFPNHTIVRMLKPEMLTLKQKLVYNSERALQDMALDGSVMALAIGKIVHGWEEGKRAQIQAESMEKYALPCDLISKYSDN